MTSLCAWLRFLHLLGLAAFLISHGVTAGAALALRGPSSPASRGLLRLFLMSGAVAFPALLLLIVTGVWMGFAGHVWGKGWIWASIVVVVAIVMAMGFIAEIGKSAALGITWHQDDDKVSITGGPPRTAS